jgi:hypothetical protein
MMSKKDKFQWASIKERLLLTQWKRKHDSVRINKFSEEQGYDGWDAMITINGTKYLVEAKVRSYEFKKYPDSILEKDKYTMLLEASQKQNLTPLYIVFYEDAVFGWDLSKKTYLFSKKKLPATTMGDNQFITKIQTNLNFKEAMIAERMEIPSDIEDTIRTIYDYLNPNN